MRTSRVALAVSALIATALPLVTGLTSASYAQTAKTTITTPRFNRTLNSGDLAVAGKYGSDSGDVGVVYVIDVSGSTGSRAGDCSGDGPINEIDDPNGDGQQGTVLDCEITALATLANQVATDSPTAATAVVAFGSSAGIADVDSSPGFPNDHKVVAATYDGPDGDYKAPKPIGDGTRERVPDAIDVLASMQFGGTSVFSPISVGQGTSFTAAMEQVAAVFKHPKFSPAKNKFVFFVSDGQASIGADDANLKAVQSAGTIFSYGVGAGTAGCNGGTPLAIIAGSTKRCLVVEDPTDLTLEIGTTQAKVNVRLQQSGNTVRSTEAPVTALGNWSGVLPSVAPGVYDLVAQGPEGPEFRINIEVVDGSKATTYVALGDSFSSGEGNDPWRNAPGSTSYKKDFFDDECHRSPLAYPMQVRNGPNGNVFATSTADRDLFTFAACAGATTKDILYNSQHGNLGRQLDYLGPDVDLVTLTIGGNDIEFAQIALHCVFTSKCQDQPFVKFNSGKALTLAEYVPVRLALLAAQLPPTYRAIRAATQGNAKIVVGGYPELFHPLPQNFCPTNNVIKADERDFLLKGGATFDGVISAATKQSSVLFKSVRDDFRDHLPCGPKTPEYLRPITQGDGASRLHPTPEGQTRYAQLFSEAIGQAAPASPASKFAAVAAETSPAQPNLTVLGGVELEGVTINADGTVSFASWITDAIGRIPAITAKDAGDLIATDIADDLELIVADDKDPECASVAPGQRVSGTASGFTPLSAISMKVSGPNEEFLQETALTADSSGQLPFSFVAPSIGTDTLLNVGIEGTTALGVSRLVRGSLLVPGQQLTCGEDSLRPLDAPFTVAGQAGQSALYATGSPKNGSTEGSVFGILRNQPLLSTPITEAGLITIDGNEVLVVRFKVSDVPWELRYRNLFFGIGTIEVCGPSGCETGVGVKFAIANAAPSAFAAFGINVPNSESAGTTTPSTTSTTTPDSTSSTTTSVPGTSTTAPMTTTSTTTAVVTTTTTDPPVTTTVTTSTSTARCVLLQTQLDQTSDPRTRERLVSTMRSIGCPSS